MKNKHSFCFLVLFFILLNSCSQSLKSISMPVKDKTIDYSSMVKKNIQNISAEKSAQPIIFNLQNNRYHFYPDSAFVREYYISNHDQDNPKSVAFALENLKNITIDGQGAKLVFHGRMIPFSVVNCENVTLKNFTIDFETPAFRQLTILGVDTKKGEVIAEIYPKGKHKIINKKQLVAVGEGYENTLNNAMPFRQDKRLAYGRQDVALDFSEIEEIAPDTFIIKGWGQTALTKVGERFALRSYHRPTPGIFVSESRNLKVENIKVHYAEGMGILAQMTENITLDGFSVCLKEENDPRYFTTQADATHFSACKGVIISKNGLYEGMADDAINVHGTYLKVTKKINDKTLQARYMHPQAWGFKWGEVGDTVQFVESNKMEVVENHTNTIQKIKAVDKPSEFGAKEFEITFEKVLPKEVSEKGGYGIENLTWTPEVHFTNNIIRNNRARGALFSTPKPVFCENNTFDHTHGTAILLCGDCNGWYETGACRNVTIKNNTFNNALTANYQFTNAIISIYPEIPNLKEQNKYFHSGILIENNTFNTFDRPILYAKSVDGILFKNNKIKYNAEFQPFHWNEYLFYFQRVNNVKIENNDLENYFEPLLDMKIELSPTDAVTIKK